jgi:oligosaccharide reducing-end xylanase
LRKFQLSAIGIAVALGSMSCGTPKDEEQNNMAASTTSGDVPSSSTAAPNSSGPTPLPTHVTPNGPSSGELPVSPTVSGANPPPNGSGGGGGVDHPVVVGPGISTPSSGGTPSVGPGDTASGGAGGSSPTPGPDSPESSGGDPVTSDGGSGSESETPPSPAVDAGPVAPGCIAPTDYPNLLVTVGGHTQEESDAKVEAAWNQLYNPSNNNTVYYDGPGSDESYVKDTGNNDVRTEGMSYGMMTAVQLDKQTEFDRLWTWVKNHMANGTGEISWKCSPSGSKSASGGAPDGEEYMATALIFAHNRWGDGGKIDYATEAKWVLDLIRTKYFNEMYHIVKFVSGSNNTDGSYVLPAFYQAWACFDTENADFWTAAVDAGRKFFQAAADGNGVIPDQSSFTGQAQGSAGSDAKRCVMNIMMDANFFGVDPWQTDTYAPAFSKYMSSHGDNSAAQFSCNSLLAFGLPADSGKPFIDKIYNAQIPSGQWRYYDGTLYMLSLLHVSGTFKLYY